MVLSRGCNGCTARMVPLSSGFHRMAHVGRDTNGSPGPTSPSRRVSPEHCSESHPDGSWIFPMRETPQLLWAQSLTQVRNSFFMGRTFLSSFHDIDAWMRLSPIIPWCWIFINFGLHTRWLFVANSFTLSESSIWSKFTIPPSKTKLCLSFESLQVLSQFHINSTSVPGSCPYNFKL